MCEETKNNSLETPGEEGSHAPFHRHEHTHTKEVLNRLAKAMAICRR